MSLEHLFDAELEYRPGMPPVAGSGEGQLIGSGEGTVRGGRLDGTLRWTLFEQPGTLVCSMNPILAIVTDDDADLKVEGRGYARRDHADDSLWRVAATLLFATEDERYDWLNGRLALWEGTFDAARRIARYRAYVGEEATTR